MKRKIKYLHNSEIDLDKWDSTILGANNSRIYAESWYLDIIEPDWMGLIVGDYDYVMPVIANSKFGIRYAFQPTFCQQHGIFPSATPEIAYAFIEKLKELYAYFNVSLNAYSVKVENNLEVQKRKNYILSLNHDLEFIKKKYNSHSKRYTRKASKLCSVSKTITLEEYIALKKKYRHKGFSLDKLKKLQLLIHKSLQNKRMVIYGAYSQQNELFAAACFLKEKKRFTYLNSVSSDLGKENRAMYAIIDRFIADHANRPYLLDFEGSNIEGIARFFSGFGAEPETYQHVKYNNLPWLLKLIKH